MHYSLVPRNATTDTWGFQGDPDIYGLGIRLGYYLQALSMWVANFFVPHEARYMRSLNVLFILAMLIAMIYLCALPTKCYGIEIFLLHQISYTIASVSVAPSTQHIWSWNFRHRLIRDALFVALETFSVWYWYIGLAPGMLKPTPSPEGTPVWWLNQGDLYGWIRVANMVISPPLLALNTLTLANLLLSKRGERHMDKALSASGFHNIQKDLVNYSRQLKNCSLMSDHAPESPLSTPAAAASPTESRDLAKCSFSTEHTFVSEAALRHGRAQNGSIKTESSDKADKNGITPMSSKDSNSITHTSSTLSCPPLRYPPLSYLHKLQQAHVFLEDFLLTSKHVPVKCKPGKNWILRILLGFWFVLLLPWRFLRNVPRLIAGVLSHENRYGVIFCLLNYIHHLPSHRVYELNKTLPAIWNHPNYLYLDQDILLLLVKMRNINKPPPPLNRKENISNAIVQLASCLVLIISVELPLWWNYIHGVQVFGLVGQLIPFCLGAGGLVKVGVAFFDERMASKHRRKSCECNEGDEEIDEIARLWKEIKIRERAIRGDREPEDEMKDARRFEAGSAIFWFRVSTLRLKS